MKTPLRLMRQLAASALVVLGLVGAIGIAAPAAADTIGTGAVSFKGPSFELLPGVTVEIRRDSCNGQAVWHTTTTDRPDAYGAFGIGLPAGNYCVNTLSVPDRYTVPAPVMFTVEPRPANWLTVWVHGPSMRGGALVAKDADGWPLNGVTARILEGPCAEPGEAVWQGTTANHQWGWGGSFFQVMTGRYCLTTLSVPSGYQVPPPFDMAVEHWSLPWVTVWVPGAQ